MSEGDGGIGKSDPGGVLETGRNVLFVGGAMRSGTTLAARLLVSSGRTNPLLAESQYLGAQLDLAERWRAQFDLFLADYFGTPARFDDFSSAIARQFLQQLRDRYPGSANLVLKHPESTRHFPLLTAWLPDARFVVTVRDPRDAVASMVAVGDRLAKAGETGSLAAFGRDMRRYCEVFRGYYAPVFHDTKPFGQRMLIVRYEDIVTNRNDVIGELARFAGIEIDLARLGDEAFWKERSHWAAQRDDGYVAAFWSPGWVREITDANVGRHVERLSAAEIDEIKAHCADFGKLFRYW